MRISLVVAIVGALLATPAMACEFKAKDGSAIRFLGTEQHPYAVINGEKCSFTNSTFTCGGTTTSYEEKWDRFTWRGAEYITTDNCAMVE